MKKRDAVRIVHLCDVPSAAPILARWFVEEWGPWYGPGGAGNAESDLAACRSRDALPICLVALSSTGEVRGTAALKSESLGSDAGVGPWLAAVLVGREHRGKGVATALIAAIEKEAARLGVASLYASTDSAEQILRRRGWRKFAVTESLRGPVAVYRLAIGRETPSRAETR